MSISDNTEKIFNYFLVKNKERKVPFAVNKKSKPVTFTNPISPVVSGGKLFVSTVFIPGSNYVMNCSKKGRIGDIVDVALIIDKETEGMSRQQVIDYLNSKFGINFGLELISTYLKAYNHYGFDLVPLAAKQKAPFEKDWVNKEHKDITEWQTWLDNGFNIGIKTGIKSNITVIDIDTKEIPDCLKNIKTLVQETRKGFHFVFKYEKDIPSSRIAELKIDILNDGRQFVAFPSIVDSTTRKWNFFQEYNTQEIPVMPEEVKKFVFDSIKKSPVEVPLEEKIKQDISNDVIDLISLQEGGRNIGLTKFGGILRKQLNNDQTSYVLNIVNKNFVKPPLSQFELRTIVGSLDKYSTFDDSDLARKIVEYLRYAEEGLSRDIKEALGESKTRIDKALAYLVKEQLVVKRGRMYHLIKQIEWSDTFPNIDAKIQFKMPYFDDVAHFNYGDMVLIGGKSKVGKTTLSMNIVKQLVEQKIKPYYICLETGSRFIKTAANLGMKEGDFFWSIQTDPTKIELAKNSVTVLDWLLIEDKAKTDMVMQYFVNQLVRTNSFLILFMQLKQTGDWFAPNMVTQFPAFAARYLYEKDDDGSTGSFHIDAIRESKKQTKKWVIPCKYLWEERRLVRVDEMSDYRIKKVSDTTEEIVA